MKKILFSLCLLFGLGITSAFAQPPVGDANVGDTYGVVIEPQGALDITKLNQLVTGTDSVDVKIKAEILDVCPKKGCWVSLRMPNGEPVFVRMKNYAFFLPLNAIGKEVVLEGKAFKKVTSVKELQHYAEDKKLSKEEIAKITKPKEEFRFLANGIVVVE